jgi:hypothetical protein
MCRPMRAVAEPAHGELVEREAGKRAAGEDESDRARRGFAELLLPIAEEGAPFWSNSVPPLRAS